MLVVPIIPSALPHPSSQLGERVVGGNGGLMVLV